MRTSRGQKLFGILLLLAAVAAVVRERRASSQIQVASFPAVTPSPSKAPAGDTEAGETTATDAAEDAPVEEDDLSTPFTTAPAGPGDDLKQISGIGPKLESMLHDQGITTFAQLAALTDADIDRLDARLTQFPGRIRRDAWVSQAKDLAQG